MNEPFLRCVKAAGLDPTRVTPHTLRHTAITRFSRGEQRPKAMQKFSGHKSLAALNRYLHPSDEEVNEAMDKMQERGTGKERSKVVKLRKS